jgi:hypothetical protein
MGRDRRGFGGPDHVGDLALGAVEVLLHVAEIAVEDRLQPPLGDGLIGAHLVDQREQFVRGPALP